MNTRVVVVDDDKEFLEELQEILQASGYDLVVVNNSRFALSKIVESKPDVVLLDLKMPGKNGFELATEMNRAFETEEIPVIVMTAYFKDEYKMLMDLCGVKRCLKKPFYPLDVISAIEGVL